MDTLFPQTAQKQYQFCSFPVFLNHYLSFLGKLENPLFHQIEGYEEFNYNFKNGIQEFFTKFWQVPQDKTTTYLERLV